MSDAVGFQFTIVYDQTKLTFVNCTNWVAGLNAANVQINQLVGKLTFVYTDVAINIADGKFFDLNFTVLNGSSGNAAISWSDSPTPREFSNSIPKEINCVYSNGTVLISNSSLLANVVDLSCFGETHPVAKVTATGEVGRTFFVQWATVIENVVGSLTAKIPFTGSLIIQDLLYYNSNNSNVGYYFYVSDDVGSTAPVIGFAFVKVQNPLQATVVQDGLNAEITITGGILPYSYRVGSGAMINLSVDSNTFQIVKLLAPSTVVTVYDAHGCFLSIPIAVAPLSVIAVPGSGNNMEKTFNVFLTFNRDVIIPVNGFTAMGGTVLVTGSGKDYTLSITAAEKAIVQVYLSNAIIDAAGNKFAGKTLTFTVDDFTRPVLINWSPTVGSTIADNYPTFRMTFDENIFIGTGGNLKVYKINSTTPVLTIPISANNSSTYNGNSVTIDYAITQNGLDKNTNYYVLVDGSALKDNAGNAFAGINDASVWNFKTGPKFATLLDTHSSFDYKIYPNPVSNELTIEIEGNTKKVDFEIFNTISQVVSTGSLFEKITIPTTSFVPGVYLIKFKSGNLYEFKKIIKE